MKATQADGTVLVLTRARKSKHGNYLGRDEQERQWYEALVCGHPVRDPKIRSCHDCHAPNFKKRKHKHYLGQDADGIAWYLAPCGHRVRSPYTTVCQACPSQRKGKPSSNRVYANALGVIDGKMMYMAECGHPATSPRAKKCLVCRVNGATSYPTEGPNDGREKKHRVIAERVLGRPLKTNEIVHHINLDKRDFRNCNLLICDKQYHAYLHAAMERKYGEMCNPPIQRTA